MRHSGALSAHKSEFGQFHASTLQLGSCQAGHQTASEDAGALTKS